MEIKKRTVTKADLEKQLVMAKLSGNVIKAQATKALILAMEYKRRIRSKR